MPKVHGQRKADGKIRQPNRQYQQDVEHRSSPEAS